MKAVITKAWADLRVRLWQSALIALSVGAAAALLYLGLASFSAASSPYEKQMARANGAHAWFYLKPDAAGHAAADRIAARPEVADSLLRDIADSYLIAPDSDKIPWVNVTPMPPGQPPTMGYLVLEGHELTAADGDAALLPVSMGHYLHVAPGDSVRLQTESGPQSLRVAGLIADPKACTFPRCGGQPLYVLPERFQQLSFSGSDRNLLLGVRLHDPQAADAFLSRVRTGEGAAVKNAWPWTFLRDFYQNDRVFTVVPILLFAIVAMAAAAMILANIIGGAVLGQYREIAVLKSLGFTGAQVLALYVGQTLCLSLLGVAGGVAAGHLLTTRSMAPLARTMGTPDVLHFMPFVGGLVVVIVLPVAALFAALAASRAVRQRPAAMLAEGFDVPAARMPLSVRVLAALRLPVPAVLGVKDAMARPARATMTVLSLMVCLVTITEGLNFPGVADRVMANQDLIGVNWDMTVQLQQLPLSEAEDALRRTPGVAGYYRERYVAATIVDQEFDLHLRAVDGDWRNFSFRLLEGRLPEQPGEILLAPRVWERVGARVGTQLLLQLGEKRRQVTVVGKYQDALDGGRIAMTTAATLEQPGLAGDARPYLRVKFTPGADWLAVQRNLFERTDYRALTTLEDRTLPPEFGDGVAMVRLLGWVMAGIAALSIMGAALLTAREQMREVGIRKAIGMSPGQVLASSAAGGAWFGVLAVALGLPVAYLVHKALIAAMASVMGLGDMPLLGMPGTVLFRAGALAMFLAVTAVLPAAAQGARLRTARVLQAE